MREVEVQLKRLDEKAIAPAYQSAGAAGMDLVACLPRGGIEADAITITPGSIALVPTGWVIAIPEGYEGQVRPRSGLAIKHAVTVPNAPGTIDCDYRGEAMVGLINLGELPYTVRHGDRIAQLVIAPVVRGALREVSEVSETARGAGGFGSTGRG